MTKREPSPNLDHEAKRARFTDGPITDNEPDVFSDSHEKTPTLDSALPHSLSSLDEDLLTSVYSFNLYSYIYKGQPSAEVLMSLITSKVTDSINALQLENFTFSVTPIIGFMTNKDFKKNAKRPKTDTMKLYAFEAKGFQSFSVNIKHTSNTQSKKTLGLHLSTLHNQFSLPSDFSATHLFKNIPEKIVEIENPEIRKSLGFA